MLRTLDCHFIFFNDTATTEIYTLSLHDALPICDEIISIIHLLRQLVFPGYFGKQGLTTANLPFRIGELVLEVSEDRKSTRLNSSHRTISYAVFCLKKKNC